MAELTIYTASRSLQGKEVREKFDSTFADLYHDLDQGFTPINFMLPWAPLPQNRKRDYAQKKLTDTYMSIVRERRAGEDVGSEEREKDMIWNLMNCSYKGGAKIPDHEIAHMMIALLMAGQHSSSATIAWVFLRLATRPEIQDELLAEQKAVLGTRADGSVEDLTFESLSCLPLHSQVIKETLRLHAPIHSILRKVKNPMPVDGTPYTIPTTHSLLATPGVTQRTAAHFPEPMLWEPHRWDPTPRAEHARLAPTHVADGVEEKEDYGYGLVSKGAASPYLPFGAGRHRCIGEQFAYVQLGTILATTVRDFRFVNVPGREGEIVDTDYSSLFSRPLAPAVVNWERRVPKA